MHLYKWIITIFLLLLVIAPAMGLTIKNRSYIDIQKNDPKDMIIAEIGDWRTGNTAANFKPILNLSRWDEVWLTILPVNVWPTSGTVTMTVNQTSGKVTARRGNITLNFYNISNGAYEYEIQWIGPPVNYTLQWQLNMKGLTAYYQPPLNEEMYNESCSPTDCVGSGGVIAHRPENVVGSYAFYSNKFGNYDTGKSYQTGKAFHFFRMKLFESGGNATWVNMNLTGNILIATMPKDFFATAKYPVTLDPFVGWDTPGGSFGSYNQNIQIAIGPFTAGDSGTATHVSFRQGDSGANNMKGTYGFWNDDDGYPGALNANTNENNTANAQTWVTTALNGTGGTITDGNDYWIGGNWGNPDGYYWYQYDSTSGYHYYYSSVAYTANHLTAIYPAGASDVGSWRLSLYVEFTTEAGGAPPIAAFNLTSLGKLISSGINATHRNASIELIDTSTGDPGTDCMWYPSGTRLDGWMNISGCSGNKIFPKGVGGWFNICLQITNDEGTDSKCQKFNVLRV
jgi:hypothetical protein